jgi:hypothetical protein
MATELPIACSLDAAALGKRGAEWRALAERALIEAELEGGAAQQRYRREPGVAEELRRLVTLEGECCPFLDFEVAEEDAEILLRVSGPPEAAEMVALFAPADG